MFDPKLALLWEKENTYTLAAVTMTPHNGYSVGAAHFGTPGGMVHVPEAVPVTLTIANRTGMYFPIETPVTHSLGGIELGGSSGKTSVVAYTVLDEQVVGFNSTGLHEPTAHLPISESEWSPVLGFKDWHAVVGLKNGKRTLFAGGAITFRAVGYSAMLVAQDISGQPDTLMCALEIEPPPRDTVLPMLHDAYVNFESETVLEGKTRVIVTLQGDPVLEIPIQTLE